VGAAAIDLSQGVFLPSIDTEDRSLRRYAGQKLLNTQGAELGTIKDFIVHPLSSHVRYLVVSSGGVLGGMGNSLRLVPTEVVRLRTSDNRLEVDILQSAWLQIPPISDENYVTDHFDISTAQHQGVVQRFGTANYTGGPAITATTPAAAPGAYNGLIRASTIRGKAVRATDRKVGNIENIIIDLARGTAAALIDSSGEFTGTAGKYLVPLSRLVFENPSRNPVGTTLTRADFDAARPISMGLTRSPADPARSSGELAPTPTGRISP
jgi:sporulation protein YlmC with PRC-barrel domain